MLKAVLFYSVILIFLATAAVTLLGIAGIVAVPEGYLKPLFGALLLELVGAVIGLFRGTDWFGRAHSESGLRAIAGAWWQLVRGEQTNALSFVTIRYAPERESLVLEGQSFTADGQRYARWWSIAAALDAGTRELRYFWHGDQADTEADFSGVGYVRFAEAAGTEPSARGDGWYITGNLDDLVLTGRRKVELERAGEQDARIMEGKDRAAMAQCAAAVCAAWRHPAAPVTT